MAIKATNHGGGITYRVAECDCGERWELEEHRARRLPPCTAVHSRGQAPTDIGERGPPPTAVSPPSSDGGVGGGLPSDPIRSESDPIPGSVDSPNRGRARNKRSASVAYLESFEVEWNQTDKTGSKFDANRAWERMGRPAFGASWKRWVSCAEWKQPWFNYPHVSTWLNDRRFEQEPIDQRKPVAAESRQAVPIAVAQEEARRQRITDERLRRITEELKPREQRPSPRQEYIASVGGGK